MSSPFAPFEVQAAFFRAFRRALSLTVRQAADELPCSVNTITKAEKGEASWPTMTRIGIYYARKGCIYYIDDGRWCARFTFLGVATE